MNADVFDNPLAEVLEYWRIVRRYKGRILLLTLGLTLASIVVIALLPDYYQGTTTILVDPQKIPEKYVTSTVSLDPNQRLTTITQEVLSATRLQEVIDKMNLYPELRKSYAREQIIDLMRKSIKIQVKQAGDRGLSAFTITYQGKNPGVVAQVTNMMASSFIEWNLKAREQQAIGTEEFLAAQLDQAEHQLEEQEKVHRDFKMRHLGEMPDQQTANMQALGRLQMELQANVDRLNRLEAEQIMLQQMPESAEKSSKPQRPSEPASLRSRLEAERVRLEAEYMGMQKRYTPAHPDLMAMKSRLDALNAQVRAVPADRPPSVDSGSADDASVPATVRLEIIGREIKRLTQDQDQNRKRAAAYQTKVDAVPVREQQLADLNRDYVISKQHYQDLLEKKLAAEMAADLERKQKGERFTILDPAQVPEKPIKPNRRALMGGATVAALLLSIALAMAVEKLDSSIKSEKDLKSILPSSVTLLASIPSIETLADRRHRLRVAVLAWVLSLLACGLVAEFLWKVHPNL